MCFVFVKGFLIIIIFSGGGGDDEDEAVDDDNISKRMQVCSFCVSSIRNVSFYILKQLYFL